MNEWPLLVIGFMLGLITSALVYVQGLYKEAKE